MEIHEALYSLAVATGAGLLIGLEREQSQSSRERGERRFGGIRTFAILGLTGGVSGLLTPQLSGALPLTLLGVLGLAMIASLVVQGIKDRPRGLTTLIAGVAVFLLGLMACLEIPGWTAYQRWQVAAAAAVGTMTLLSFRAPLHRIASRMSSEDLYAAAKLGLLLVVILPLLPDRELSPSVRLNPFEIGIFISLIAGIGFAGYLAVRTLGASRGMLLTGALGGLVSSTAVTLNFSGRARQTPALAPIAALGVAIASTLVFPRILLEVSVAAPRLLPGLAPPILVMGGGGFIATGLLYLRFRSGETPADGVEIRNPFSLEEALKFGLVYAGIKLLSGYALEYFGEAGLYATAVLAGFTDVDAITLSVSKLFAEQRTTEDTAVLALFLAAVSNTVLKGLMAIALGGLGFGLRVMGVFALIAAAGVLALWFF